MVEFSSDFKELVRDRTDLVGLISESLTLTALRGGAEYKALCPFHDDTNPSLRIYPDRQSFRCWSCQTGGDCFTWVMEREKVDFREALEMLAARAHLEMPKRSQQQIRQAAQKNDLYEVMKWAELQFHHCFLKDPAAQDARDYIKSRGFTDDTIQQFRIGYHPEDWNWIQNRGRSQFPLELMQQAQLIRPHDDRPGFSDYFVDRVMFPIHDERSRTVAFGGRLIPGHPERGGKYFNSKESPVFHKSRTLFGLNHARDHLKEAGSVIIVEGYTDCIALHQAGVRNAVAVLGTALTESHVTRLRAFVPKVVLLFDGDDAGLNNANKAVTTLLAQSIDLRVLTLAAGMDPDEFLEAEGVEKFRQLIDTAPEAWEFKLQREIQTKGASSIDSRERVLTEMLTLFAQVPRLSGTPREDLMLGRLASRLQMTEGAIRSQLKRMRAEIRKPPAFVEQEPPSFITQQDNETEPTSFEAAAFDSAASDPVASPPIDERIDFYKRTLNRDDKLECELLGILFTRRDLVEQARQEIGPDDIRNPHLRRLLEFVYDMLELGEEPTFERVTLELMDRNELKGLAVWISDQARSLDFESKLEEQIEGSPSLYRECVERLKWRREEQSHRAWQDAQAMEGVADPVAMLQTATEFHRKRATKAG